MQTLIKTLVTHRVKPFVSVVTPTWNRGAFLPYLLYMYRYQDYPADRRELIILDDSPQSHQHIIDRLTNGTPESFNIRYIHHPEKLPLGKKRNMLNELARGEYILCMDDDDYYSPDKISYSIAMMQKHRALISGSDQIPIWYSHINRIFKSRSFGPHNILNGTFCYHRNYLKKHRYDDDCNLGEEKSFTDNFSVNPLQLPGERTILCISHSHNTFDKDFILGASTPVNAVLTDIVSDPLLRNAYLGLHNATHYQAIHHQAIDQVVLINLDKRPDRLQQIREELTLLHIPPEKITRLAASENENGQRGRQQSHLQALRLAQQHGWQNYLLLEDDAVILKQEKHIQVLNALLASLAKIPWQVMILGGEISQGTMLKSLPGLVHARDCRKVCAYLVNSRYYPQLAQQMNNDEHSLEDGWHNGTFDRALPENIQPDSHKPTVLYAPTFGALSSLPHWAEKLGRLSGDVNLMCKLHHGTCSRPEEAASLALARRHLKQRTDSARHTLALLAKADYVLTDNSGFIFDAIHVDKRVILLDFPGMTTLLDGEKSYSTPESADQQIREILPVAHDVAELRYLLSEAFDWCAVQGQLAEIRHHYCDAFMDGKAGERAAMVIMEALG
ncbi:TPA: glycosyltransferase [Escherichia coli]